MRTQSYICIGLALFIIILGYLAVELKSQNDGLSGQVVRLTGEKNQLTIERSALTEDLNDANALIAQKDIEIKTLSRNVEQLNKRVEEVNLRIKDTRAELDRFEQEVLESSEWFNNNSDITGLYEYNTLKSYIRDSCVEVSGDTCTVKLACFHLVHDLKGYEYRSDVASTGKEDRLLSLLDFYNNKGGDCEDYSLAVSAELSYVIGYCADKGASHLVYEAAYKEPGIQYFVDFNKNYYYDNADAYEIERQHHYIVCGQFPTELDPNSEIQGGKAGHCALAFSDVLIEDSTDISDALAGSIIMEPQSGFIIEYPLKMPRGGDLLDFENDYFIYTVITDKDYYIFQQFSDNTSRWFGYLDFLPRIDEMRVEIDALSQEK